MAARCAAESAATIGMVGQDAAQRQHGLDAFAGRHDVARHAEADGVAEEIAHRPSRRVDRRLAASPDRGSSQVRCAPVMRPSRSVTAAIIAGQVSVGECSIGPIVAARMEAQAAGSVQSRDAAIAQIRFRERARQSAATWRTDAVPIPASRPAPMPDAASASGSGSRSRQAQEASRLVGDVVEVDEAAALADDVEQIAMLAGRGVGPFAGGALAGFRPVQPDEHGAARRVADVADQPVAALAAAVGEIVAAHRLGLARETVRQIGRIARPCHAASRSAMRATG